VTIFKNTYNLGERELLKTMYKAQFFYIVKL